MSPARIAVALLADVAVSFVFGALWLWLHGGISPWWLGTLVGLGAFAVTAIAWPPPRRGRHRCR